MQGRAREVDGETEKESQTEREVGGERHSVTDKKTWWQFQSTVTTRPAVHACACEVQSHWV